MPAITKAKSDTKVLVTGANGYIAMWVVHDLLEQGYVVRGTVRSEAKAEPLYEHFKQYHDGEKFELAIVADSTQEGAYDNIVGDVDGIIHVASPVHNEEGDPSEIINPSVQATLQVLKSSLTYGKNVKRVIYTSSTGTIRRSAVAEAPEPVTKIYSEKDWNDECLEIVQKLGKDTHPVDKYHASKVLAERAAWKFVNDHKDEMKWDFCTLHPGFTMGPFLQNWNWKDTSSFNFTSKFFHDLVFDPTPQPKDLLETSHSSVDVRDCALAHVLALQKEDAGGERILLVGAFIITHDWLEEANRLKADINLKTLSIVPPCPDIQKVYRPIYDNTKAQRILGITYRGVKEMTHGILLDYERRGW